MSDPLVTIVTPSFNQAPFLERTLESVLGQDYPHVEYAVVDGGSTDGSVEIIRRYADRLAWWTSGPDAGQADALNAAFARASGELLGWVNSDDYLLPGALSRVVSELARRPEALLAYGGVEIVEEDGVLREYLPPVKLPVEEMLRTSTYMVAQQGSLFRRRAWELAGPFDVESHYLFDTQFVLRVALRGPLLPIEEPLGAYRLHEESKTVAEPVAKAWDYVRLYDRLDVPLELRPVLPEGRAHAYLWAARLFYTGGESALARRYYLRALRLAPRLALSRAGLFARALVPATVRP
jgi:glycosyltransferase involved in cell wall biosynthesis